MTGTGITNNDIKGQCLLHLLDKCFSLQKSCLEAQADQSSATELP
jgi:hypothetical protein